MASFDRPSAPGLHASLLAIFFASGFVALLYQVIWQRLLGLFTGLDLYAVTLIVSVFMLGMGFGSFAGGALADRLPARRLLLVFAGAEMVVAGCSRWRASRCITTCSAGWPPESGLARAARRRRGRHAARADLLHGLDAPRPEQGRNRIG